MGHFDQKMINYNVQKLVVLVKSDWLGSGGGGFLKNIERLKKASLNMTGRPPRTLKSFKKTAFKNHGKLRFL